MDDWDDDTPPPLSSIADQVHAVSLSSSMVGTAGLKEGELRLAATTAPVTIAASTTASAAQTKPFKRGFLDAKPTRSSKQGAGTGNQQHFSVIKSKQQEQPGQKQIPSMFKLEPSEEQQRLDGMKQQLLSALQPNPETIAAVGKDETLSAGFEDPEVMAAVAEVARDPAAIKKYANNPKVQQFYQAFGNLMGSKLAALGQPDNSCSKNSSAASRSLGRNFLP